MGKQWKQCQTLFWGAPKSQQMVTAAMKLKDACSWEEKLWPTWQHIKKQRHYFANRGPSRQSYGFSISHVWMWELLSTEDFDALELWCWRRLSRGPWTARRSNQSILKEISLEYSLGGLMAEAETPILWPLYAKNWLIWKDPDAGKDWRQEEKETTEDEMVGRHHQLNGHEF